MDERVLGPVRGRYVASYAARMGNLGERYIGYWKVCDQRPDEFLGAAAACSGSCVDSCVTAYEALLAAEDLALAHLRDMPEGQCLPLPDEPIWSVMYVSTQAGVAGAEALASLLQASRERNARWRITGVLLAFNRRFMQYLEGPRAQLELVYRNVQKDPRHGGLTELLRGPVDRREFAGWSMAFGSPDMDGQDPRRTLPALFCGDSVPHTLLRAFLERGS